MVLELLTLTIIFNVIVCEQNIYKGKMEES